MIRRRLYTGVWSSLLFLSLIIYLPESPVAGGSTKSAEGVYGHVMDDDGYPIGDVGVTIFDGFTLYTEKTDINGEYKFSKLPVSQGLYGVVFLTKEGFLPKAENIKVGETRSIEYSTVMKSVETANMGFIIGTVYQPVRGGKIQFQSGIYGFGENKKVWLEGNGEIIKKETDEEGHFLFEVPPGKYKLLGEGVREKIEVNVVAGKSIIGNLRSGFVLID